LVRLKPRNLEVVSGFKAHQRANSMYRPAFRRR
jgi:hypothetical protein